MLKRVRWSFALAPILLSSAIGQHENGVPVEVISSSQYGKGSCGLVGCKEGIDYVLRSNDALYFLSCAREVVWDKCPILAAGEKLSLTIDAKNHVYLAGSRRGKPVEFQLDYQKSEQLPSSAIAASRIAHAEESAGLEADPISDSGNAFLAHCDSEDRIERASCKIWVDGFMSGLVTGMVASAPGEAEFSLQKNSVVCFTETVTQGQVLPLILKYIKGHPREADQPTAALALAALQKAFPCEQ